MILTHMINYALKGIEGKFNRPLKFIGVLLLAMGFCA